MVSYSSHEVKGFLVLTAEKVLEDQGLAAQREGIYQTLEARDHPRVAVDLGQIAYMSSAEIGFLISLKRRTDLRQGKVILCRVDSFIVDVLRTMRLDRYFVLANDVDEALAQFGA